MQNPYIVAQMCLIGAVLIGRNASLIVRFFAFFEFHALSPVPLPIYQPFHVVVGWSICFPLRYCNNV